MYFFDVFMQTASDDDQLTIYPSFDFGENCTHFLWCLAVFLASSLPGAFLLGFLGTLFPGLSGGMLPVVFSGLSVFLLAPPLFLSGLANENSYNLWSRPVFRSYVEIPGIWILFYVLCLALFILTILLFGGLTAFFEPILTSEPPHDSGFIFQAVLYCTMAMSILPTISITLYARLLGRLARMIEIHIRNQASGE